MKLLILIIFLFNCLNIKNFKNESLQENLLASLLGEKERSITDTVANRRVTGQLININNEIMQNVEIKNLKTKKKNLVSKEVKTNENGEFIIDLKTGNISVEIMKNDVKIGDLVFYIEENKISYSSENFKINNLLSVHIYSSGYEQPLLFVNYFLTYSNNYYLNIEIANMSDEEMSFLGSVIKVKTEGVRIYYPHFENDTSKNIISRRFPGARLKVGEYRSIYNYTEKYWKYEESYNDSDSTLRYFKPTNLEIYYFDSSIKSKYFLITIEDEIIEKTKTLEFELIITQNNGTVHTMPFQIIF